MKISALESLLNNNLKAHLIGVSRSWTDNIVGYSGIGKTYLVKQIATANDCVLISVPVSQLEPADLIGTPHPVQIRPNIYVQMYALPNWLPHIRVDENGNDMYKMFDDGIKRPLLDIDLLGAKAENRKELQEKLGENWKDCVKGAVIFMDEINRAVDDQMKNAIFEFVEKGRMHTYESPWNTYRVSAMNPPNNNYSVNEMTDEKAFMDRFFTYILEATSEEWLAWAEKRGIHPMLRDFIAADPKALMEEEELIQLDIHRTPRSYEMLSILMNETEFPTDTTIRKEIYHGVIGKEFGDNLARHEEKEFIRVPTPVEILEDYPSLRPFLQNINQTRNDYANMVNQYMLVFLANEANVLRHFGLPVKDDPTSINQQALSNLQAFILDMPAHSKTVFVRKITDYPHVNRLFSMDMTIFDSLMNDAHQAKESQ